jgi:hypothetical protein
MVAVTLTKITSVAAISILIIASYTIVQPLAKIFVLQPANAADNQTLKNATHIVDNVTDNIDNTTQFRRSDNVGSKIEPSELEPLHISNGSASNPRMLINLLSSMSPDDISKFPLKDIASDELLIVLNGLSVQDLFKTLENIPAADLTEIFNKLPQDKSQGILNRLLPDQSQEILDRLTA